MHNGDAVSIHLHVYNFCNYGMDLYVKSISFATKDFYLPYINIKTMIYV
jgi:hypothetical protein